MSALPDSVYDDAVRAYLRVPARHHISIGHLRATIDDPAAFRDALTVAYDAGAEDLRAQLRGQAPSDLYATLDVRTDPTMAPDRILIVGVDPETGKPSAAHSTVLKGVGVAEARASVALDGETVTLDEPQVTP